MEVGGGPKVPNPSTSRSVSTGTIELPWGCCSLVAGGAADVKLDGVVVRMVVCAHNHYDDETMTAMTVNELQWAGAGWRWLG